MTYNELIEHMAIHGDCSRRTVRLLLEALPEVLMENLTPGEYVRTPLGVFRKAAIEPRVVTLPDRETQAQVAGKHVVKLRSGTRLKAEIN